MPQVSVREYVTYRIDKILSGSDHGRIGFLGVIFLFLVGLLGVLRNLSSPSGERFISSFVWAAGTTLSPSFGEEETGALILVAAFTSIVGLCVVAVFIGLVNTSIEQRLELLRRGRSRVVCSGHIIILGFVPEKVAAILKELALAAVERKNRGSLTHMVVVVMSEEEKEVVEECMPPESSDFEVIVRRGNPCSSQDLRNIRAESATSIIILNSSGNSDIPVIKVLLALRKVAGSECAVVCELVREATKSILPRIFDGRLAPIVGKDTLARILVQTARSRGLAQVLSDLLTFDGSELYFSPIPPVLEGKVFGEVQSMLYDAVAVGFERDHSARLNPPPEEKLEKGDLLLILSASGSAFRVGAPREYGGKLVSRGERRKSDERKAETICILGSNHSLDLVIREFDSYMLQGSKIMLLPSSPYQAPVDLKNIKVELLSGDIDDPVTLKT